MCGHHGPEQVQKGAAPPLYSPFPGTSCSNFPGHWCLRHSHSLIASRLLHSAVGFSISSLGQHPQDPLTFKGEFLHTKPCQHFAVLPLVSQTCRTAQLTVLLGLCNQCKLTGKAGAAHTPHTPAPHTPADGRASSSLKPGQGRLLHHKCTLTESANGHVINRGRAAHGCNEVWHKEHR